MITAFEALLLPTCMAVILGLLLGFGLESLIQLCGSLFWKPSALQIDCSRAVAGARSHASGLPKPARTGRRSV